MEIQNVPFITYPPLDDTVKDQKEVGNGTHSLGRNGSKIRTNEERRNAAKPLKIRKKKRGGEGRKGRGMDGWKKK